MSVRAFAQKLGVSPAAVRRAARDGRLSAAAIGRDAKGHLVIVDAERARREWEAHTRPRVAVNSRRSPANGARPVADDDSALPLALAKDALVELAVEIEKRLLACFRETVRLVPAETPATRWQTLARVDTTPASRVIRYASFSGGSRLSCRPSRPEPETYAT